jgi:RND family efflux transporter MFP subunit
MPKLSKLFLMTDPHSPAKNSSFILTGVDCLSHLATLTYLGLTGIAVVLVFASTGCRSSAPVAPPPPVPQVEVVKVVQKDVRLYSEWVGTTEGFVNAQIYPKISGYLLKQEYQDGDHVRMGQALFEIDSREYQAAYDQAAADAAQKHADFKQNQQDLARYTPLLEQQVISKQQFDHINQATKASAAAAQSAEAAVATARLNLQWTHITAPIDGLAGIAKTQVGDLVSPTTLLTTVSQLDPIKVSFPISEREYLHFASKIKQHQETGTSKDEPALSMILADDSTYPYPGHFYVANRQVNVQTGTIIIQGLFPNPGYILRPGMYAKVRAGTDVQTGALLVPQGAVLETQGQYQVAVVNPDNTVSLRQVTLGKQVGTLRIVASGLKPDEEVVSEGVQKVTDGMTVNPHLVTTSSSSPTSAATPPAQS